MDNKTKQLHLNAARKAGIANSCTEKIDYKNFETALKSSILMSGKYKKPLEPYPCPFCEGWHIGREMSRKELESHNITPL
jgi:hypothetical protein